MSEEMYKSATSLIVDNYRSQASIILEKIDEGKLVDKNGKLSDTANAYFDQANQLVREESEKSQT